MNAGQDDGLARAEDAALREAQAMAGADEATDVPTGTSPPAVGVIGRLAGPSRLDAGIVGGIAADRVTIGSGIVAGIAANQVAIDRCVSGGIIADRVSIVQGGAARILAGDVAVTQGGAGAIAGWNVRLGRGSFAGAVIAGRVEGEVRALLDWRGVLAASLAILGIALLRRWR